MFYKTVIPDIGALVPPNHNLEARSQTLGHQAAGFLSTSVSCFAMLSSPQFT